MPLRPYQTDLINSLRQSIRDGHKRIMLCAPTGSGKTVMFSYMVQRHLSRGGRAAIFTHRGELLKQANRSLSNAEIITSTSRPDLFKPLHIVMVETVHRRLSRLDFIHWLSTRTMVVFDEAHLSVFDKIFPHLSPDCIVIGASATPYRKGKNTTGLDELYSDIVQGIDTPELIAQGYLSPCRSYGVQMDLSGAKLSGTDYDMSKIYEDNRTFEGVVKNWKRLTPNTKTILFASNVESSERVCAEFVANGIDAKHIDGKTSKQDRLAILKWFDTTCHAVLCNCGVLTAGFDQPDIETVILYRATTSLPLYLQMVGRGSRIHPSPRVTHFNLLDFGNNITRLNFWEAPRTWSLKKDPTRSSKLQAMPIRVCTKCDAMNPTTVPSCQVCGFVFPKPKKEDSPEVELSELAYQGASLPTHLSIPWREMTVEQLIERARHGSTKTGRPYKLGWIVGQLRSRPDFEKQLWRLAELKGYKPGWVQMNLNR